jgi:hypothetical protein
MPTLVTEEQALRQLRLVSTSISADELTDVMFKVEQASAIVIDYLKLPDPDTTDPNRPSPYAPTESPLGTMPAAPYAPATAWTDTTCPPLVQAAILIVLTALYDGRTPDDELLSGPVMTMLNRLRDPALA